MVLMSRSPGWSARVPILLATVLVAGLFGPCITHHAAIADPSPAWVPEGGYWDTWAMGASVSNALWIKIPDDPPTSERMRLVDALRGADYFERHFFHMMTDFRETNGGFSSMDERTINRLALLAAVNAEELGEGSAREDKVLDLLSKGLSPETPPK
jgi:hypothetical protein